MNKKYFSNIQKRVIAFLKKIDDKPLHFLVQDNCSELSRLVGCLILEKEQKAKTYILKGERIRGTAQCHDVLIIEKDKRFYLMDPTIWQFFKNKKEMFLGEFYNLDDALNFLRKKYKGKWNISEKLNKNSCKQKDNWIKTIEQNIKDELVSIRKLKLSDTDSFCNLATDKELRNNLPYPNRSEYKDDVLKYVQEYIKTANKLWKEKKEYQFGIEDKKTKKVVGFIGLLKLDWKNKKAEVGYWVSKKYRGRGFAKEVLNQILIFAFGNLKLRKVYAEVNSLNIVSYKLLERCGFKLKKKIKKSHKLKGKWTDQLFYEVSKREFKRED